MATKKEIKAYCLGKAQRARDVLAANYEEDDIKTSAVDALADLLHLCHKHKWEFDDLADSARMHFEAEQAGGEHG